MSVVQYLFVVFDNIESEPHNRIKGCAAFLFRQADTGPNAVWRQGAVKYMVFKRKPRTKERSGWKRVYKEQQGG
jgi:hypothetical protein